MARSKHEFSEEEINYILENWGKESAHSMKNKFGCTWYAVVGVAKEHGLELPESNNWTDEEVNTLIELADKYHYKEIAKMMGKSENAIYLKARKLGIVLIQNARKWTFDEEELFKELWGTRSIESIAKELKRTVFSLKVKAVRMGLGPMIQNNYSLITVSELSEILNITRDRIIDTWVKLGLKLKKKRLTEKMTYYTVSWEDLMKFLKENQNEWDSRLVEVNMLGPEPDWLKEKRKKDKIENPLWYRKWTDKEIEQAVYMLKRGKSYEEIAKELNRSPLAIGHELNKRGYSYLLPQYWKYEELKYLEDNYENRTYKEIGEDLGRTEKAVAYKASKLGYQKVKTKQREVLK